MFQTVFSIVLIIASNVFYNIVQKSTPSGANPFAALFVTYLTAAGVAFAALLLSNHGGGLGSAFLRLNWTSFALALCIFGLEFGYLMAYRAGWNISVVTVVANILLAILLIPVGVLLFKENFSPVKIIGILLCVGGLTLLGKK